MKPPCLENNQAGEFPLIPSVLLPGFLSVSGRVSGELIKDGQRYYFINLN